VADRDPGWRRSLGRELSRQSRLKVREILGYQALSPAAARRIGITGPPGAGKSSLIAAVAARRLARGRYVGVLAIDPTSPVSQGSLLGDRIRMDAIADDARLFIRSIPSGPCHDGLCRNVVGLLATLEAAAFDDIVLETVGVGQVSYEARNLVDTLILVLVPESGDTVQAMKAGLLEVADIYVVNKSDLPAAERLAAELRSVMHRRPLGSDWSPPIIMASTRDGRGIEEIDDAIEAHWARTSTLERKAALHTARSRYQFQALLRQRFDELSAENAVAYDSGDLAGAFAALLERMPMGDQGGSSTGESKASPAK
jgi:LAO/AO transport system kinase